MTTTIRMALLFSVLFAFPLLATEWSMFHGPEGNNRSPDTGLLTSWSEGGPKLLWKISDIGEGVSGYSSVTIQNGRLFTSGNRGGRSIVYCFDLDGNKLWEYENGPAWTGSYPATRSTPTVDGCPVSGCHVYDLSAAGELVCLTACTGTKVWSRNILTDFEGENLRWALSESIRIDGDRLYCAPGGKKASFVALDKRTGEIIWTTPSLGENTSYASPIIVEQDGLRMIITMYANGVFGVNSENGELLFKFRFPHLYGVNVTRPLYHEGYLFITSAWADRGDEEGGSVKLRLTVTDGNVSLEEVWRIKDLDSSFDNVILLDGFLYGVSWGHRGGAFVCIDWKTGETRQDGMRVGRGSSFTWAEGLLYFLDDTGGMFLIRPNPEMFEIVSKFYLPEEGEGPFWAHPVVIGQRLYIRHGTFLHCFDIAQR